MEKSAYIFDSHALVKFFQKEKGHEKILHLLEEIQKKGDTKYINAINLGEVVYITKREFGDQKKIEVLANIERLKFAIVPIPTGLILQAAEYKAEYNISYADCFALASSVELKAVIVTGDPDFKKVEYLTKILWI